MNPNCLNCFVLGWEPPTPEAIHEFKQKYSVTTKQLAALIGIKDKYLRAQFSEKAFLNNRGIDYWNWRYFLECAGEVTSVTYKRNNFGVNPQVFVDSSDWVAPTLPEFLHVISVTGRRPRYVNEFFSFPTETVENWQKSVKFDRGTKPLGIQKSKWFEYLERCEINDHSYLERVRLPESSLETIQSLKYVPPTPLELRSFLGWAGLDISRVYQITGLEQKDITYYLSNKSHIHGTLKLRPSCYSEDEQTWTRPDVNQLRLLKILYDVDGRTLDTLNLDSYARKRLDGVKYQFILNVDFHDWHSFLALLGAHNYTHIQQTFNEFVEENKAEEANPLFYQYIRPIPYAAWRLLLTAMELVEQEPLQSI